MATEVYSLWGATGWLAQSGDGYTLHGKLGGETIWFDGPDPNALKRAFSRAARAHRLRAILGRRRADGKRPGRAA